MRKRTVRDQGVAAAELKEVAATQMDMFVPLHAVSRSSQSVTHLQHCFATWACAGPTAMNGGRGMAPSTTPRPGGTAAMMHTIAWPETSAHGHSRRHSCSHSRAMRACERCCVVETSAAGSIAPVSAAPSPAEETSRCITIKNQGIGVVTRVPPRTRTKYSGPSWPSFACTLPVATARVCPAHVHACVYFSTACTAASFIVCKHRYRKN